MGEGNLPDLFNRVNHDIRPSSALGLSLDSRRGKNQSTEEKGIIPDVPNAVSYRIGALSAAFLQAWPVFIVSIF